MHSSKEVKGADTQLVHGTSGRQLLGCEGEVWEEGWACEDWKVVSSLGLRLLTTTNLVSSTGWPAHSSRGVAFPSEASLDRPLRHRLCVYTSVCVQVEGLTGAPGWEVLEGRWCVCVVCVCMHVPHTGSLTLGKLR